MIRYDNSRFNLNSSLMHFKKRITNLILTACAANNYIAQNTCRYVHNCCECVIVALILYVSLLNWKAAL